MTSVIFDPDAKSEFLSAVQYYENCQSGLGRRFRLVVESAVQDITESPFRYRVLHAPYQAVSLAKISICYHLFYRARPHSHYCCWAH